MWMGRLVVAYTPAIANSLELMYSSGDSYHQIWYWLFWGGGGGGRQTIFCLSNLFMKNIRSEQENLERSRPTVDIRHWLASSSTANSMNGWYAMKHFGCVATVRPNLHCPSIRRPLANRCPSMDRICMPNHKIQCQLGGMAVCRQPIWLGQATMDSFLLHRFYSNRAEHLWISCEQMSLDCTDESEIIRLMI